MDPATRKYYIRLIEATPDYGVARGILDITRFEERQIRIYRVKNATSEQKNIALSFCVGELGAKYKLDLHRDISSSEVDWYCSELIWAAYISAGINLQESYELYTTVTTIGVTYMFGIGVTPRDITVFSSKVEKVNVN